MSDSENGELMIRNSTAEFLFAIHSRYGGGTHQRTSRRRQEEYLEAEEVSETRLQIPAAQAKDGSIMKAVRYEAEVYGGAIDFAHGFGTRIQEIFVPEKELAFNLASEKLNAFRAEKARTEEDSDAQEIEIPDGLVNKLESLLDLYEECSTEIRKSVLFL